MWDLSTQALGFQSCEVVESQIYRERKIQFSKADNKGSVMWEFNKIHTNSTEKNESCWEKHTHIQHTITTF